MVSSLHRSAVVTVDGTLAVRVPELAPGQRVRVTIEPESPTPSKHAIELLEESAGPRLFKSAAEVDAYVRAERDMWNG